MCVCPSLFDPKAALCKSVCSKGMKAVGFAKMDTVQ